MGLGPRRVTPPDFDLADLPPIDAIIVSHNHYDHCDVATLARISREHPAPVLTPLGNDAILHRTDRAIRTQTFDWGESASVGPLKIYFEPANHWSQRRHGDARMALWASFVIADPSKRLFRRRYRLWRRVVVQEHREHRSVRLALLPIGAYAPRWFMGDHHCDPRKPCAFQASESRIRVRLPWGTFRLTDEPYNEPVARLKAVLQAAGITRSGFAPIRRDRRSSGRERAYRAPMDFVARSAAIRILKTYR